MKTIPSRMAYCVLIGIFLMAGRPAVAATCQDLQIVTSAVGLAVKAINLSLKTISSELLAYQKMLQAVLESRNTSDMLDDDAKTAASASTAAGELTKPIPGPASATFTNAGIVIGKSRDLSFHPMRSTFDAVVKDLALEQQIRGLETTRLYVDNSRTVVRVIGGANTVVQGVAGVECLSILSEMSPFPPRGSEPGSWTQALLRHGIVPAVYREDASFLRTDVAYTIKPGMEGRCRQDMQMAVDNAYRLYTDIKSPVETFAAALQTISDGMKKMDILLKPIQAVEQPITDIYGTVKDIHKFLHEYDKLLDTHIKIKDNYGKVVFNHSVRYILKEWHKVIKKAEDELGITDVKKKLEGAIKDALAPIEERIKHRIKKFANSIEIEGFSLADVQNLNVNLSKQGFQQIKLLSDQLGSDATNGQGRLDQVVKACKAE